MMHGQKYIKLFVNISWIFYCNDDLTGMLISP